MANDYLSLFVADINRSFDGLVLAIERDEPAMSQAALHARDLADALGSVGLLQLSAITADVARQLGMEQPSVLPLTLQLIELLKKALEVLESTDDVVIIPDQIDEIQKLASKMLDLTHASLPAKDVFGLVQSQQVEELAAEKSESHTSKESLTHQSSGPAAGTQSIYSSAVLAAQRRHALNTVQRIRRLVFERAPQKDIDALLGDHQDALLEHGQMNLGHQLHGIADHIEASLVFADSDVLEVLVTVLSILPKAAQLKASKQALTLFIDLHDISPSPTELDHAGRLIANLSGRLEYVDRVVRLIVPSSLKRMRVIPFVRGADQFVISWAQLVSVTNVANTFGTSDVLGGAEGCPKEVILQSGCQSHTLYAEELLPVANMNVFTLPTALTGPEWLRGVALDNANQAYSWISLGRS